MSTSVTPSQREVGALVLRAIRERGVPSLCEAGHYRAVDCLDPRPCGGCPSRSTCPIADDQAEEAH